MEKNVVKNSYDACKLAESVKKKRERKRQDEETRFYREHLPIAQELVRKLWDAILVKVAETAYDGGTSIRLMINDEGLKKFMCRVDEICRCHTLRFEWVNLHSAVWPYEDYRRIASCPCPIEELLLGLLRANIGQAGFQVLELEFTPIGRLDRSLPSISAGSPQELDAPWIAHAIVTMHIAWA